MILGYARVSTSDQNLDGQRDALEKAGAGRFFADTITGTARHRPELDRLLDQLRPATWWWSPNTTGSRAP